MLCFISFSCCCFFSLVLFRFIRNPSYTHTLALTDWLTVSVTLQKLFLWLKSHTQKHEKKSIQKFIHPTELWVIVTWFVFSLLFRSFTSVPHVATQMIWWKIKYTQCRKKNRENNLLGKNEKKNYHSHCVCTWRAVCIFVLESECLKLVVVDGARNKNNIHSEL